jgi:hypothetical protein
VKLGVGFRALEEQHGSLFSCTGGVSFFFLFSNFVFGCHKESSTKAEIISIHKLQKKHPLKGPAPHILKSASKFDNNMDIRAAVRLRSLA